MTRDRHRNSSNAVRTNLKHFETHELNRFQAGIVEISYRNSSWKSCAISSHAMLPNSNGFDPIEQKNQILVKLMYVDLGFEGIYPTPNSVREIDFSRRS